MTISLPKSLNTWEHPLLRMLPQQSQKVSDLSSYIHLLHGSSLTHDVDAGFKALDAVSDLDTIEVVDLVSQVKINIAVHGLDTGCGGVGPDLKLAGASGRKKERVPLARYGTRRRYISTVCYKSWQRLKFSRFQ